MCVGLDELAIHIRHDSRRDRRSFDQDGGTDDGLALCVGHRTLAGAVLGKEAPSSQ